MALPVLVRALSVPRRSAIRWKLDQIPQRLEAHQIGVSELHRVEQLLTLGPEYVRHARQYAFFGHHRMHLRLDTTAELHPTSLDT